MSIKVVRRNIIAKMVQSLTKFKLKGVNSHMKMNTYCSKLKIIERQECTRKGIVVYFCAPKKNRNGTQMWNRRFTQCGQINTF